jgi:hypothetical protein
MYSLGLANMGKSGNLVPKHYVYQVFVQFETLAKNQNFYQKVELQHEEPINKKKPLTRCDLPMGTKRGSFMSRSPSVKQQKTVRSSPVTKWNHFEPLHHLQFEKEVFIMEQVQLNRECPPSSPSHEYSKAKCTSQDSPSPPKQNKRGPNMEMVAYQLTQDLTNIFMQRQDWSIYHKEMVLQDNIRGEYSA